MPVVMFSNQSTYEVITRVKRFFYFKVSSFLRKILYTRDLIQNVIDFVLTIKHLVILSNSKSQHG